MDESVMVLLSGGLDSATCLALQRDKTRHAIAFDYGQRHIIELERAREIAALEGVELMVLKLPMLAHLDDVVFALRNAMMIVHAAYFAKVSGCNAVVIGCNQDDWVRFPDCRPAFLRAMDATLKSGYGMELRAPLMQMRKREVVSLAKVLKVPIERTWSCYDPQAGEPCGKCLACEVRRNAGA